MDKNDYENADKVLKEVEDIVGTTDPDIAAARTSHGAGDIVGRVTYDCCAKRKRTE